MVAAQNAWNNTLLELVHVFPSKLLNSRHFPSQDQVYIHFCISPRMSKAQFMSISYQCRRHYQTILAKLYSV